MVTRFLTPSEREIAALSAKIYTIASKQVVTATSNTQEDVFLAHK